MFSIERWQEVFQTIAKNKLRTFLTALSVASGIFILVVLLGFSTGIQTGVKTQFAQDAESRLSVFTSVTTKEYAGLNPGRQIQMKIADYENATQRYGESFDNATAIVQKWRLQVNYGQEIGNYRVQGIHPDNQFIENATLTAGRFLNQNDVDEGTKIVIIGQAVKDELFKQEDPIGKTIKLAGVNFKVAGVYTDPGGQREEQRVFIPITTSQRVFNGGNNINQMAFEVSMSENFDEAVALSKNIAEALEADLKATHRVSPDDENAIRVRYNLEEAAQIYGLIDTIKAVFWFIGIGTIIAGVVGVSNIMLIIVKERTKEIGVRKALGALPSSIVGMILQEAIFITAIAGFVGLFLAVMLLNQLGPLVESDFIKNPTVDFPTAITTVIILIVAGALAGFVPARRAAMIRPIEALRDE